MQSANDDKKALEELAQEVRNCRHCILSERRFCAVLGEGNDRASLMIVGQAPGEGEDMVGRPFIGPSGRLLRYFMGAAGLSFGDTYRTNLLKCMIPRYSRPKWSSICACLPFLEREIALLSPKVILALGKFPAKVLLKLHGLPVPPENRAIPALFGKPYEAQGRIIFPMPHPASIIYNHSLLPDTMEGFRALGRFLQENLTE